MLRYPTLEEVRNAGRVQLGYWLRFLPSPGLAHTATEDFSQKMREEVQVLDQISVRFGLFGGWTPEVSKAVGLEMPVTSTGTH